MHNAIVISSDILWNGDFCSALQQANDCNCATFLPGIDACKYVCENPPDIFIVESDGNNDFSMNLAQSLFSKNKPTIALALYCSEQDNDFRGLGSLKNIGFDAVYCRPVAIPTVLSTIKRLLSPFDVLVG